MSALVAKIGGYFLTKLLTEKFLGKVIVYILDALADSTANKVDDKIVSAVAEALGVDP